MARQLKSVDQLGFDEQVIEDAVLEKSLEEREKKRVYAGAARKDFKEAHARAVAHIERLELPEGGVARVGRFRISRSAVAGKSVSFETAPTTRLKIGVVVDDE